MRHPRPAVGLPRWRRRWPSWCVTSTVLLSGSFAYLDATTLRFRRHRHGDFEYTIAEVRLGLLGDCSLRKRNHTIEAAVSALASIEALAFFLALVTALTLNRHGVLVDLNGDVVPFHTW